MNIFLKIASVNRTALSLSYLTTYLALMTNWIACTRNQALDHLPVTRINESTLSLTSGVIHNLKFLKTSLVEFPEQLPLTGKIGVTEDRTTVVPARVGGRIESIAFASGEYVKKGQILATLFSPDYIAAREEYLQSVKQTQNSPNSKYDSPSSDSLNLVEMTEKKLMTMGLNSSDIKSINASSSEAQSNLPVRSPRDGFIISKSAALGSLVNPGDSLFTIADLSRVWFSGDLYPEDINKVKKNQEVIIRPLHGGPPIFGKVSFISPVVDPSSRTIKIRALMNNADNLLRADMYVQGSLVLNRKQALMLPNSALIRTGSQNVVFKQLDPPSIENSGGAVKVQQVMVELGTESQGFTEITHGIREGDVIVSEGALLLNSALISASQANGP